jgi:ABC-type polysaccharide/polyol phosphate export permease
MGRHSPRGIIARGPHAGRLYNHLVIFNLYRHRGYIWRTAWSEVRTRYAGAGLGVLWNFIQPLAMILIFTVVFTSIMRSRSITLADGRTIHYTVYLCAAMLPWNAFCECVTRGTQAFVANAIYLRKLPIPEQVFVAQSALSALIHLAISFTVLVVVALVLGHTPTWHWALVPIPAALLIAMGFGIGLVLGTLNAFIRDIGQIVPIILQVGFWLYPIVYDASILPPDLREALLFNPVYPFLTSIRDLFISQRVPGIGMWIGMLAWTGATSAIGYLVLRRLRPELRDVI